MMIGKLSRLYSISSVSLFLEINITQIEAFVALFAFVVLISQFLENDMFSNEMDPCMQFRSRKGLEKTLTFKISIKQIYISFCDRVPLKELSSIIGNDNSVHSYPIL